MIESPTSVDAFSARRSCADGSSPSDLLDLIGKELDFGSESDDEAGGGQGEDSYQQQNDSLEALVQKRLHEERNRNYTYQSLAKNRHQELMKNQQDEIDTLMNTLQVRNQQCSELRRQIQVQQRQLAESGTPTEASELSDTELPAHFLCPITRDLLVSPVTAADGHTYEKAAILRWITTHSTSPVAGTQLPSCVIIPNFTMRSQIAEHMQIRGLVYPCSDFTSIPPWARLSSSMSLPAGASASAMDTALRRLAAGSGSSDDESADGSPGISRPTGENRNRARRMHALWRRMQL
jgi:hypothetical protein